MKHVVVLGGGFGGLNVVKRLAKCKQLKITLIDKTNHHLFQPLLYQVATAGLNPAEIAYPIRSIFKNSPNVTVWMDEVIQFDFSSHTVVCKKNKVQYDYLVIALGSENNFYGNEQWADYTNPLKSITDALTIRERILCAMEMAEMEKNPALRKAYLSTIIIGGGPTGVEIAGAIAELKKSILEKEFRTIHKEDVQIFLIEGAPRLLRGFHPGLSKYAEAQLTRMGVTVLLNTPVKAILENCVITDTMSIRATTIIWAAGVRGNHLLERAGIPVTKTGNAIVDPFFRLPDFPNVYVIGDLAHYQYEHTFQGKPLPAVSPVAIQSGKFVAKDILRRESGKSSRPFYYRYKGMMSTIGRSAAVVEFPWIRLKGFAAWLTWVFVHLMYLVDFQNRLVVFLRWVFYYFTWKKGSRLITRIFSLKISKEDCSNKQSSS